MDLTVFEDDAKEDPADQETVDALASLELDLGLQPGFVKVLLNEDDWSFVVKTYALVEAAITQLLITAIVQPKINDDIATLPMRTKLALMTSLDMLSGREKACILALTAIRNRLAHNISHVRFDLAEYLRSLPTDKLIQLATEFQPYRSDEKQVEIDGKKYNVVDLFVGVLRSLPKRTIHDSFVMIVALISQRKRTEQALQARNMTVVEFADKLFRSTAGSAIADLMRASSDAAREPSEGAS